MADIRLSFLGFFTSPGIAEVYTRLSYNELQFVMVIFFLFHIIVFFSEELFMKVRLAFTFLLIGIGVLYAKPSTRQTPNVIVILADDLGYADLSSQRGSKDLKTPNIDKMIDAGVVCTNGYVTSPQCAPSRAGLMMGRYNQRIGFDTIPDGPLPLEIITLAERMKDAGYATGHVGKWHLEPNAVCIDFAKKNYPESIKTHGKEKRAALTQAIINKYQSGAQGFDDFFSGEMYRYWSNFDLEGKNLALETKYRNFKKEDFRIDIQTKAATCFIDRHHDKPFFLYLCYYAPHVPLEAPEKYLSRFPENMPERRKMALAMVAAMDDGVGQIRGKLYNYGILENTLIFFLADNGAPLGAQTAEGPMVDTPAKLSSGVWDGSRNEPLTGEKGMLMEGGIRVPFVVSWPAKLPKGKVYSDPVISLDIAASSVAATGRQVPAELEGIDLIPAINGANKTTRSLYWRFWNQAAIRQGKYKYFYLGDGRHYLVDLDEDISERHNLISKYPEIATRMKKDLEQWTEKLEPKGLPTVPPNGQEMNWYKYYLEGQSQ